MLSAAITGTLRRQQRHDRAIGLGDAASRRAPAPRRRRPPRLSRTVRLRRSLSRERCSRLEARRVDEHELRVRARVDAHDAMARGLRLLRRDADLLARSSAFMSVDLPTLGRPTIATWPQRNAAAPPVSHAAARSPASSRCAPSGELRRRLLGRAPAAAAARGRRCRAPECGIRPRTVCACASPVVAITTYSGTGMRRPCSHSCSRVLGSLPSSAGSACGEHVAVAVDDHARARPRSRRRRTRRRTRPRARRRGSTDGRRRRSSARPRPAGSRGRGRVRRATRASVSWLTSAARTRERSPSGSAGKALVERGADDAVEHRVADEFEPLVVASRRSCGA